MARGLKGCVPTFGNLRWEGGEFAPRPKTYLRESSGKAEAEPRPSEPRPSEPRP